MNQASRDVGSPVDGRVLRAVSPQFTANRTTPALPVSVGMPTNARRPQPSWGANIRPGFAARPVSGYTGLTGSVARR